MKDWVFLLPPVSEEAPKPHWTAALLCSLMVTCHFSLTAVLGELKLVTSCLPVSALVCPSSLVLCYLVVLKVLWKQLPCRLHWTLLWFPLHLDWVPQKYFCVLCSSFSAEHSSVCQGQSSGLSCLWWAVVSEAGWTLLSPSDDYYNPFCNC